jgi:hypothetical protein
MQTNDQEKAEKGGVVWGEWGTFMTEVTSEQALRNEE